MRLSVWTHVAGVVRIEALPAEIRKRPSVAEVEDVFKKDIPEGSEGPLNIDVVVVKDASYSILFCNVIVWGDLRDFGWKDVQKIADWIERVRKDLDELGLIMGQAVIAIDAEDGGTLVLCKKRHWVRLKIHVPEEDEE